MSITALVEVATGRFIEDGSQEADGVTYVRVPLDTNPDALRQRYSGQPHAPFVEVPMEAVPDVTVVADTSVNVPALVGAAIWSVTGKQPDPKTIEIAAQRYAELAKADA